MPVTAEARFPRWQAARRAHVGIAAAHAFVRVTSEVNSGIGSFAGLCGTTDTASTVTTCATDSWSGCTATVWHRVGAARASCDERRNNEPKTDSRTRFHAKLCPRLPTRIEQTPPTPEKLLEPVLKLGPSPATSREQVGERTRLLFRIWGSL